jgi:hypothetical protein
MAITPSSVSFGSVTVNSDATQTMKLSNTGTAELTISQAAITGTGFSMSGLSAPVTLAAGASTNFTVAFNPTSTTAASGSVSIGSDASNSPMMIPLSGTGVASTSKLSPNVSSLSFGTVTDGTAAIQNVTLTNTGNSNVTISSASASGTGFSVSGGSNVTLTPSQSATVAVSFDPQTQGALSGTLTVSSNAPVLQIPLSGTGAQAVQHSISLSWSPSTSQVIGYFIYRGTASGGPYSKIESSIDSSTSYVDTSVADGQIYYYVVTSVDSSNVESAYSNQVAVTIPSS